MRFFETPPLSDAEVDAPRREPWAGTWADTHGAVVPISLLLVRTEEVAVVVTKVIAYPAGFTFDVVCVSRSWRPRVPLQPWSPPGRDDSHPSVLRFGLRFADGSRVTNLDVRKGGSPEAGPLLRPTGGFGADRTYTLGYWCEPLPPEGPMSFVCEWPQYQIPVTQGEVDGGQIRALSRRATPIWNEDVGIPALPSDPRRPRISPVPFSSGTTPPSP